MKAVTVLLAILLMVTSGKVLASNDGAEVERQRQIDCLASNIFYEARGETEKGKIAVGLVTINRAKDARYPDDICAVVAQKGQFSWYKPGKIRSTGNTLFQEIKEIATTLYDDYYVGNNYVDFVYGATHFHHVKVNPRWSGKKKTAQIGSHLFFKIGK